MRFITATLLVVTAMFSTGCAALGGALPPEAQALLQSLQQDLGRQSVELRQVYERYKSGELTVAEMQAQTENLKAQYATTSATVGKLQEQNVPIWQMVLYGVLGLVGLRGMPSKGPVPMVLGLLGRFMSYPKGGGGGQA